MSKFKLSDTQLEIMDFLWENNRKTAFQELLDYFNLEKKKDWHPQTLRTQLVRLSDKGIVFCEKKNGLYTYIPLITKEENVQSWVIGILNDLFEGSVKSFMFALSGGNKLDQKSIDELREFIDQQ